MANSKTIVIYLLILLFFNFFTGAFIISQDSDKQNQLDQYLVITKARNILQNESGFTSSVLKVVLVPFLIFDLLFYIFFTMTATLGGLPVVVNTLIYAPLLIIGLIDYIMPMIRGN